MDVYCEEGKEDLEEKLRPFIKAFANQNIPNIIKRAVLSYNYVKPKEGRKKKQDGKVFSIETVKKTMANNNDKSTEVINNQSNVVGELKNILEKIKNKTYLKPKDDEAGARTISKEES